MEYDNEIKPQESNVSNETEIANKKKINSKMFIALSIIAALLIVAVSYFITNSGRKTFASETEMKEDVIGTYCYFESSGKVSRYLVVRDDAIYNIYPETVDRPLIHFKWKIDSWNYKKGVIKVDTNEYVIMEDGNIKDKKNKHIYTYKDDNPISIYNTYIGLFDKFDIKCTNLFEEYYSLVARGTISNISNDFYYSITIKCNFFDAHKNIVSSSTATIYNMNPNDKKPFEIKVSHNNQVRSCQVEIIDCKI